MYNPRRCLWFGTLDYMDWAPTPNKGAESTPEGMEIGGSLINGGGFQVNSWGSHKTYTYEWPSYSAPEAAQLMKSYRDGTYGRGLIYFIDPLIYEKNILPARIADPSMAVGNEGASMVYGMEPVGVPTSGWQKHRLPILGAYYNLANTLSGFRGIEDATFIPIPTGYALVLGAFYDATGSGGIFASPQNANGTIGSPSLLTPLAPDNPTVAVDLAVGIPGVWLWLGKSVDGAATVTARGLIARLVPEEYLTGTVYGSGVYGSGTYGLATDSRFGLIVQGPWVGGMGHSGVRFSGSPSFASNSPLNGGQVGYAASFREVGSWAFG